MTSEEQFQSSDGHETNGTEDENTDQNEDETTISNTSSEPPARRSRFFRSKRKKRLNEGDDGSDAHDEPVDSSESPEQPFVVEISTTDSSTLIKETITRRSSPPPPPPSTDDTDEVNTSASSEENQLSSSIEDLNTERQRHLSKNYTEEKKSIIEARPPLPGIYAGYQRKKSQSVKLTRIGPIDSYPKKAVRFADDFGLDLSQIKMIKSDELPHVPSAAFKDLHISNEEFSSASFYQERVKIIIYLEQQFENPIHGHGFDDRVSRHKISLEQANAIDNRIYGTIKIFSLGFNKRVKIRLTTDNWTTYNDHEATYVMNSFDGTYDRFSFTLEINRDRLCVGNIIQFCLGYESYVGSDYWDNNYQQNYRFECVSRTIPDYSS